jgi:hypothetical protein
VSILRFASRRFGERALKNVLDALAPELRATFEAGISPGQWVPYRAVNALVEAIDRVLGTDDLRLVVECGRAAAEGAFEVMRAIQPPNGPSPELLLAEMPTISKTMVRGVEYAVRRVGRGYARVEVVGEPEEPPLAQAVAALGFLHRSLERFGANEVEVTLLSAKALGDPKTVFDITWLA